MYVIVHALRTDSGSYVYCISVELHEIIKLVDDSGLATGTIWYAGSVGTIGSNNLPDVVETVRRYVERFANDYLAANPRNQ